MNILNIYFWVLSQNSIAAWRDKTFCVFLFTISKQLPRGYSEISAGIISVTALLYRFWFMWGINQICLSSRLNPSMYKEECLTGGDMDLARWGGSGEGEDLTEKCGMVEGKIMDNILLFIYYKKDK